MVLGTCPSNGPPWVGVLLFGIILTFGGVMFLAFGSSLQSDSGFYQPDSGFTRLPMMMGTIALVFGLIIIAIAVFMFLNKTGEPQPPRTEAPYTQSVEKQVIREVIKVRCRYCGTLNDVDDKACSACGSTL